MISENIMHNYIIIIGFISFFIFLLISKLAENKKFNLFLDKDFNKPQAFHDQSIPRIGGLASIICLIVFFTSFSLIFKFNNSEYFFFAIIFFILGFLDDTKVSLKPITRLALMIIFLTIGIYLFNIEITKTGFTFLNNWLENSFFQYIFLILCFLFIINGCNLTDGFNGLLAIHLIIINSILLYISLDNEFSNFNLFLSGQIFIIFCFLLFNFPKAKIFMGDSGAYLFGSITSLNVIQTSINNPNISPLFFTTLLFYFFFEVFFSFIRKLKYGKSPLKPDSKHLHMLIFKYIKTKKFSQPNPFTGFFVNLIFLLLIIPGMFLRENGLLCRYWFLFQLIAYLFLYLRFYNFTKKLI